MPWPLGGRVCYFILPLEGEIVITAAFWALRPRQWVKNGIVYAALIFSEQFRDWHQAALATGAFAVLCMLSSTGYVFNDLRDVEADRNHPEKCKRPIARGALPIAAAWALMVLLLAGGLGLALTIGLPLALAAGGYLLVTLTYSAWAKHQVLLDAMFIAGGFILRAIAGAEAINVPISPWFLITLAFGSLYLGFAKRGAELNLLKNEAANHRKILAEYTTGMIRQLLAISASCAILSYAIYTFAGARSQWLMVTIPLVMYGIFRYLYLIHRRAEGGAPDATLFKDPPMWVTVLLFVIAVVLIGLFAPDIAGPAPIDLIEVP